MGCQTQTEPARWLGINKTTLVSAAERIRKMILWTLAHLCFCTGKQDIHEVLFFTVYPLNLLKARKDSNIICSFSIRSSLCWTPWLRLTTGYDTFSVSPSQPQTLREKCRRMIQLTNILTTVRLLQLLTYHLGKSQSFPQPLQTWKQGCCRNSDSFLQG